MNFAQNKFLIGYGAVLLVGCGALGFMAFKESGRYTEAQEAYQTTLNSYKALSAEPLYPDADGVAKLKEQQAELQAAVDALNEKLIPMSFPITEVTPEQFQDTLRASVTAVVKKAAENNVTLPDKFYLGFDPYQNQLPSVSSAPYLLRQLKTLEMVVTDLIESRISAVREIKRDALPEEGGAAGAKAAPLKPAPPKPAAAGAAAPAANVANVERYPFQINITADQSNFRNALNRIVGNDKQFIIVRNLTLKNENEKPLARASATGAPGVQAVAANSSSPAQNLQYIVGTEKVEVDLQLEMVVFTGNSSK